MSWSVIVYKFNNPVSFLAISFCSRTTWAGTHCTKLYLGFTHRSDFAAHFLLLLLSGLAPAVVEALARRAHAHKVVISVHTAVATGAAVMDWLITDIEREERCFYIFHPVVFCFLNLIWVFLDIRCCSNPSALTCSRSRWICSVISWMSESIVFISRMVETGATKTSSFTGPLVIKKHISRSRCVKQILVHE